MARTWDVSAVYCSRCINSLAVIDNEKNRRYDRLKVYNIYIKEECVYHNLPEKEFKSTWDQLNGMVGLMKTEYDEKDLSYRYSEVGKILDESVGLTD